MKKIDVANFFVCPVCKMDLSFNEAQIKCDDCNFYYRIDDDVPILLPPELDKFKWLEAEYHDVEADSYSETNMITSFRVTYYHEKFLEYLRKLPSESIVLEVGGGDGSTACKLYDSELILIQSDISFGMVKKAKVKASINQVNHNSIYSVFDAEQIPCRDRSVDAVIIVAALHHLPSPELFLKEVNRVLKPGGHLIVGFEPNTWPYFFVYPLLKFLGKLLGLRKRYRYTEASIADQGANGFSEKQLISFSQIGDLEIIELQRIWYLNGFVHVILSSINSKFFAKGEVIDLPLIAQSMIVSLDNFIARIYFLRGLCWHWTLIAKKRY